MWTLSLSAESLPIVVKNRPRLGVIGFFVFGTLGAVWIGHGEVGDGGIEEAVLSGLLFLCILGVTIHGLLAKRYVAKTYMVTRNVVTCASETENWSEPLENYKGLVFAEIHFKMTTYEIKLVHKTDSAKTFQLAHQILKWPTKDLWIKLAKLLNIDAIQDLAWSEELCWKPDEIGKPLKSRHAENSKRDQFDPKILPPDGVDWSRNGEKLVATFKSDGTQWIFFALSLPFVGLPLLLLLFFKPTVAILGMILGIFPLYLLAVKVRFTISCTPTVLTIVTKSLGISLRWRSLPLARIEIVKAFENDGFTNELRLETAFKSVSIQPIEKQTAKWLEAFLTSAVINAPTKAGPAPAPMAIATSKDDKMHQDHNGETPNRNENLTVREPDRDWRAPNVDRDTGWTLPAAWRSQPLDGMVIRLGLFLNWICTVIGVAWIVVIGYAMTQSSGAFGMLSLLVILVPGSLAVLLGRGIMFVLSGR